MFKKSALKVFLFLVSISFLVESANAFASDFRWDFRWPFSSKRPIHIVGSSTVSPFMAAVSEEFARVQNLKGIQTKTPMVESTGSTSGFREFCQGVGLDYPDFVDGSRPMKESEREFCKQNGVNEIIEIKIGYDGIVLGNLSKNKKIKLTKEQIFLALAEKVYDRKSGKLVPNFYQTWNQIDASLPKKKILIYGPPLTSGTREVFADIMLEEVCFYKKEFVENYPDYTSRKEQCHAFRKDGKFVESGENDRLIIESLTRDPDSFGIFGFNFLVENKQTIQAIEIDQILPTHRTIISREYALSRPLFVYFKKEHLKLMPQMADLIREIISEETIGANGYLINGGLVPLSEDELLDVRKIILSKL